MKNRIERIGFTLLMAVFFPLMVNAAAFFKPRSMTLLMNDITAKTHPRRDYNGDECALVKLVLVMPEIEIEGQTVGTTEYHKGEYWVYLTGGTKMIRIKHDNYSPLMVNFSQFDIKSVEGGLCYELIIDVHNDDPEEARKLKEYAAMRDKEVQHLKDSLRMVSETDEHKLSRALETGNKSLLKELAEKGYKNAYFPYANKCNEDEDLYEAEKWATQAVKADNSSTQAKFLLIEIKNKIAKRDEEREKDSYRKQSMKNSIFKKGYDSEETLDLKSDTGEGPIKQEYQSREEDKIRKAYDSGRYSEAIALCKKMENNSTGQFYMGLMYQNGDGVKMDKAKAAEWFKKAALQNDKAAQNNLGLMYESGVIDGRVNYAEAVKWYRMAAENGHPTSQHNLANMYYEGKGTPKDSKEAFKWFRKAADNGVIASQVFLGYLYFTGEGIERNPKYGIKWYSKAAEQGDLFAQKSLAEYYYEGRDGIEKDFSQALKWATLAAEQGDDQSQVYLGAMYYNGEGVESDPERAIELFRKAAAKGNKNALRILNQIGE